MSQKARKTGHCGTRGTFALDGLAANGPGATFSRQALQNVQSVSRRAELIAESGSSGFPLRTESGPSGLGYHLDSARTMPQIVGRLGARRGAHPERPFAMGAFTTG